MEHTVVSSIAMSFHPQIADADQALVLKPFVRHPGLSCQGLRQVPVAFATERGEDRLAATGPQSEKMADLRACPAPLFPVTHTDTPPDPLIDLGDGSVIVRNAIVVHPTSNVLRELVKPVAHRDAPAATRQSADAMLERREGCVGPTQLRSPESKAEEHHPVESAHPALHSLTFSFSREVRYRVMLALTRSPALTLRTTIRRSSA